MEYYKIPRGIKVRETIAYGMNGKQIIYLAFGLGGGLGFLTLPLPIDLKIAGGIISATLSLLLSLAKRHGQELDRYIWNSAKYTIRKKEWNNHVEEKEQTIVINIRARQHGTA